MADSSFEAAQWLKTARTLREALPYMRQHAGSTIVIKYGGHAMGDQKLAARFAEDIVLLKQVGINPIVVHGGGPQIKTMLDRLNISSEFVDGLRITSEEVADVVEMVLSGTINKWIVSEINKAGGTAVGISGKDGNLIRAEKATPRKIRTDSNIEKVVDLGFVGTPSYVNPQILTSFASSHIIPVIAPVGLGLDGKTYNINGDSAAGAIASAVGANRLLLLTDVPGVLNKEGTLIHTLSPEEIEGYFDDGTIHGGMIPKLKTCLDSVKAGVEAAVILDGRVPHNMLLEIFTSHGAGTFIQNDPSS